ncbi:MAG: L-aspartate oxidase [Brevinematia bacterium]
MEYDVIVVGSGISGGLVSILLANYGFSVCLLNKSENIYESNTYYAQGGIVYSGENDSPELLAKDIDTAGGGICNPEIVKIVSENAYQLVKEILIEKIGVEFSKNPEGLFDLTEEGAHSTRRILHVDDTTGKSIEEKIIEKIKNIKNINVLNNFTAIDIITIDHHTKHRLRMYKPITALGIYALNNKTKKVEKIESKIVILATGGMGQIYLHTTNPLVATGDGYAMSARAGCRLVNMEYTQFHPTTLYHPGANNFLISEAVRGEGAIILNTRGEEFMHKYHPLKELAPRDIVTRSILNEMLENGEKFVYLDATRIGKEKVKQRFPNIYKKCLEYGIDISVEPIPIVPAFHFSCGGILTDSFGRTNIERLFAVGEVACTGLHGANRLASTSLLEGVVFAKRIADFIKENAQHYKLIEKYEVAEWIDTGIMETIDPALTNQDWNLLKNIMWNYVGAIRSKKRLRRAIIDLNNLKEDIENFYRDAKLSRNIIELRNAVQTGLIVAQQALANRESIGAHYRID